MVPELSLIRKETIEDDSKVILKLQTSHFKYVEKVQKKQLTIEEYFVDVDAKTFDRLYKLYEIDFVLFNYTAMYHT